jgi:hypothetical protein
LPCNQKGVTVPSATTPDQRLLLGLLRLATEEYLPHNHRISRIAQTTALSGDAESLTDIYWRDAERDATDMVELKHFHPDNVAIVMAKAVSTAGYLACLIRTKAEAGGRAISRPAWNLLVSALTALALRYDTTEGFATLTATVDQISAEVAAL